MAGQPDNELVPAGVDISGWRQLAVLPSAAIYGVEPGVLVVAPKPGVHDSEDKADYHRQRLESLIREIGSSQTVIVLIDNIGHQDKGARRTWANANPQAIHAVALVCSSTLARAIGSFYLGIARPAMPTKLFATFDQAREWARAANQRLGRGLD